MFPVHRTPRSLLAMAVAVVAMVPLVSQCEAMPIQMNLPSRTECSYDLREE
jgi:hypothetical protein